MSNGQIAVAAASAVLLASLVFLAASRRRRPRTTVADDSRPLGEVGDPTVAARPARDAPARGPEPVPSTAAEDLIAILLGRLQDARKDAARRRFWGDLVDEGVSAELEGMRATFAPKEPPSPT